MDALRRGRLQVVSAAFCWSLAGACVKLARPLDAWQIAGLRSIVAFVFLALALKLWRARPFLPSLKVSLLAFAYASTVLLFIVANTMTTAANAIFLQDTAPVWVMVFAPVMLKEPLRARDLWMLLICALGMTLFFFDELSPGQKTGNIVALVSGVGFGFVILGMRWGRKRGEADAPEPAGKAGPEGVEATGTKPDSGNGGPNEAEQLAIWGNLFCFLLCVPMLSIPPATAEYAGPLALITAMGVFQLGLGYLLLARGIKHVPAMEASLLVLIEPVLNPVWTLMAAGERPSTWALAGGSVIIGTVAFQALRGKN